MHEQHMPSLSPETVSDAGCVRCAGGEKEARPGSVPPAVVAEEEVWVSVFTARHPAHASQNLHFPGSSVCARGWPVRALYATALQDESAPAHLDQMPEIVT